MKYLLPLFFLITGCGSAENADVPSGIQNTYGPIATAPPEPTPEGTLIDPENANCKLNSMPYRNPCGNFQVTDDLSAKAVGDFYCILDKTQAVVECEWAGNDYQNVSNLFGAIGLIAVSESQFCALTNQNKIWCWGHDMQAQSQ